MNENTNIIRIGNSEGSIIMKTEDGIPLTPFSALDRWCDENCHEESCSVEDALQYVDAVRKERNDKTIMTW